MTEWILVKHKHGLSVHSGAERGISIGAFSEVSDIVNRCIPGAMVFPGIAHHLNEARYLGGNGCGFDAGPCVFAWADAGEGGKWILQIKEDNEKRYPSREGRWWNGTDVGASSASIFAFFTKSPQAAHYLRGMDKSLPQDAGDFGRCKRLLDIFPEWKDRLQEFAQESPGWKKLADKWDELEKMGSEELTKTLQLINR